jgi:hypothetical protein
MVDVPDADPRRRQPTQVLPARRDGIGPVLAVTRRMTEVGGPAEDVALRCPHQRSRAGAVERSSVVEHRVDQQLEGHQKDRRLTLNILAGVLPRV